MPLSKYTTMEAAEKDLWCIQPDHKYYLRLRELFDLAYRLNPIMLPHGIFKYASLEQADGEKESWIQQWALQKNKG